MNDEKWNPIEYNPGEFEAERPDLQGIDGPEPPRDRNGTAPPPPRPPKIRPNMTAIANGQSSAKIKCKQVSMLLKFHIFIGI